jgi:cytochrome c oxidase cbb3-type subunit 3
MSTSWKLGYPFRATTTALAVMLALALAATFAYWWDVRNESRRLLINVPDAIPRNPQLNQFAMSRGRSAFTHYCASCHGSAGQPDSLRGIPDLRDHDWLYGSGRVEEIERVVLYGIRSGNSKGWDLASMPAFATRNPYRRYSTPSLTPREIDDVTEYVYSFQHSDADPDAAVRGKQLFDNQSRGLCWDCHGGHGQGDPGIGAPKLNDSTWLYGDGSRRSIHASIAYGRGGSCPAWIGKLSPVTITELAVFTHSLSSTNAASANTSVAHE